MAGSRRAFALFDRDGTLMEDRGFLSDPGGVVLLPRAAEGLRLFRRLGFGLLVVTNQSGIGRGYFTLSDYEKTASRLDLLLKESGVSLDGTLMCPHAPEECCACRKPQTGLVERAAREWGFDPKDCIVVGDKLSDMQLARNLGCRSILVRTGHGRETERRCPRNWDLAAEDVMEAASLVEAEAGKEEGL